MKSSKKNKKPSHKFKPAKIRPVFVIDWTTIKKFFQEHWKLMLSAILAASVFFLAIWAGYLLGQESLNKVMAKISQEKNKHLVETCDRLASWKKSADDLQNQVETQEKIKPKELKTWRKNILLQAREMEKINSDLEIDYNAYRQDLSLELFGWWQKEPSDRLHDTIRNLPIYGAGYIRALEKSIWQDNVLTSGQKDNLRVEYEELGWKLKSVNAAAPFCGLD